MVLIALANAASATLTGAEEDRDTTPAPTLGRACGVEGEEQMARAKKAAGTGARKAVRSPKAGRPREEVFSPPQVRRRRKTAHVAVRKDTLMMQTDDGPRVRWGVTKPKIKKR